MSATCIEVLVALFGLMIFKKAGLLFRLLILLLLYGAATDIFGWTFYKLNRSYVLIAVDIYTLAEALLMVFIIESTGLFNKLKHIFKLIYLLLFICYILAFIMMPLIGDDGAYRGTYSFGYLSTVAVLAAWASLKWIEGAGNKLNSPVFVLLTGVFIYTFCSVFIDSFIGTTTGDAVWWIHDAANITAYLIFAYCFYLIKKTTAIEKSVINLPEKV
ncbi:MAG TPA: hypothetical protein PLU85_04545 [Bacteroidia bacterium]|nr:hypothetical protein [Bacteroidia bacterium]MBP7713501.1 hypothetical protein [Bacteroidia bacterium]HOZ90471.1 hypothetical protein [Bacteroidia bacterium]HQW18507.1 hypothetical protein [Bacteroidia bacterium]HQW49969.1 hypothetical protein [Bacteroidia bacterium]